MPCQSTNIHWPPNMPLPRLQALGIEQQTERIRSVPIEFLVCSGDSLHQLPTDFQVWRCRGGGKMFQAKETAHVLLCSSDLKNLTYQQAVWQLTAQGFIFVLSKYQSQLILLRPWKVQHSQPPIGVRWQMTRTAGEWLGTAAFQMRAPQLGTRP